MGELSYTTDGDNNLVSFKSAARVPITSLKAHFKPKQDLHGYSKPWIGGTGKNLFDESSVTFGKMVSKNRTIIDALYAAMSSEIYIYGQTSITLMYNDVNPGTVHIAELDNTKNIIKRTSKSWTGSNDTALIITPEANTYYIYICISSNDSTTIMTAELLSSYKLQLEIGSTATSYEPYENICPIEGWQEVEVYQRNQNLISTNVTYYDKAISITFPAIGKNLVNDSKRYVLSNTIMIGTTSNAYSIYLEAGTYRITVFGYEHCYGSIRGKTDTGWTTFFSDTTTGTFTLTKNDYYKIVIGTNTIEEIQNITNVMLTAGTDIVSTYEPFDNTVYGGYVDIAAGEVVEEYSGNRELNSASMTFRNSTYDRFGGGRGFKMDSNTTTLTDAVFCDSLPIRQDLDSEDFPYMFTLIQKVQDISYLYYIVVLGKLSEHPELTDASTTLTYCNEWLSEHNISVRWKKTPITYKIPPTQLNTLLDFNTFYSNTNGNTEVSYQIHDSAPIRAAKHRIAANEPHIETIENSLAQFKTDMIAPLKECKVHFEPIQSGGGNASPENIRGIYGWNGCELYRTGKNLCNVQFEQGTINGNTSEELESSKKIRSGFVNLKVGRKYTIYVNSNSSTIRLSRIYTYNNNNMVTSYSGILNASFPYSVNPYGASNDGINYNDTSSSIKMRLLLGNSDSSIISPSDVSSVMIQLFGEDATYEPYIGTTLPIAFPSEAGTIYGGYIDLIRGEIVEEWQAFDMTQLNLTQFNTGTSISIISAFPGTIKSRNKMYCNILTPMANPNISDTEGIDWNNNRINICLSASRELDSQEKIEQWLNDLKNNGTTPLIVANMATPITYSIDPLILKTLPGQNNIWSNANGPVEIKYWTH